VLWSGCSDDGRRSAQSCWSFSLHSRSVLLLNATINIWVASNTLRDVVDTSDVKGGLLPNQLGTKGMWLQDALAALEEAQQSADTTAAIQSRMAEQSEVLQQLQSQLEEARQQQVRTLKLMLCTVVVPWMSSPVTA
jgi:hypothetical protein